MKKKTKTVYRKSKKKILTLGNYSQPDPTNLMGNYSISMARSGIFYPALKLSRKIKRTTPVLVENNQYKIKFDQLMDQTDFNILVSIFSITRMRRIWQDGSMTCMFNLRELQKVLGIKSKSNHEWLKNKLAEMRKINIEIHPKTKIETWKKGKFVSLAHYRLTGLIRNFDYLKIEVLKTKRKDIQEKCMLFHDGRQNNVFGQNTVFYVTFESEFVRMIYEDINIYCNKLMPEILKIKSGTIQAMVKFLLTHKKIQISLDKLLYTIGIRSEKEEDQIPGYIYMSAQRYKQIKSDIRNAKELLKEKFGILITDKNIVHYSQHKNVWYSRVKIPEEVSHPKKLKPSPSNKEKNQDISTKNGSVSPNNTENGSVSPNNTEKDKTDV